MVVDLDLVFFLMFFVLYAILWWCLLSWLVTWFEEHPKHRVTRFFMWPNKWLAEQFRKTGRWMNGLVNRKARTRGKARRHDRH